MLTFPSDPTQFKDSDGDGYGDSQNGNNPDAFKNEPSQWQDLTMMDMATIQMELMLTFAREQVRVKGDMSMKTGVELLKGTPTMTVLSTR